MVYCSECKIEKGVDGWEDKYGDWFCYDCWSHYEQDVEEDINFVSCITCKERKPIDEFSKRQLQSNRPKCIICLEKKKKDKEKKHMTITRSTFLTRYWSRKGKSWQPKFGKQDFLCKVCNIRPQTASGLYRHLATSKHLQNLNTHLLKGDSSWWPGLKKYLDNSSWKNPMSQLRTDQVFGKNSTVQKWGIPLAHEQLISLVERNKDTFPKTVSDLYYDYLRHEKSLKSILSEFGQTELQQFYNWIRRAPNLLTLVEGRYWTCGEMIVQHNPDGEYDLRKYRFIYDTLRARSPVYEETGFRIMNLNTITEDFTLRLQLTSYIMQRKHIYDIIGNTDYLRKYILQHRLKIDPAKIEDIDFKLDFKIVNWMEECGFPYTVIEELMQFIGLSSEVHVRFRSLQLGDVFQNPFEDAATFCGKQPNWFLTSDDIDGEGEGFMKTIMKRVCSNDTSI